MMEASGKRNRMIAGKNTLKHSTWPILLGVFVCVSNVSAQQPPADPVNKQGTTDSRHIERLGEVSTDEWEMDLALPSADPVVVPVTGALVLPDTDQNQRLQQLLSSLAANPGDTRILGQLNTLLTQVLDQANGLTDAGSLDEAGQLLNLMQSVEPGFKGLNAAKNRLKSKSEASELLKAAEAALESQHVLEPENNSAFFYYSQALEKDPQSQAARLGMERVQKTLVDRALESARELDFDTAELWLLDASAIREDQKTVEDVRTEVATFKQQRASELEQKAIAAMNSGEFTLADFSIIDLIALGGQEAWVASLRARLEEARLYGGFEPGQLIRDELLQAGGHAPEIVIIAADSYLMGSRRRSDASRDKEEPQHRVTIKQGFGIGVREISVADFRLFVESTGYRSAAELSGSSRVYDESAGRLSDRGGVTWEHDYKGKKSKPDMPVLHVNAYDADAYVQWLSIETGKAYRLPSESEFEYVARADRKTTYWWGEGSPAETVENLTGERDKSPAKRRWTTFFLKYGDGYWGPAPVGSFSDAKLVHPMGVYDIAGNVSEWMADCWHDNYMKAPADGSAWVNPGCKRRVARGGYWASAPEQSRAAFRFAVKAESHGPVIGFRIARDL
jgi:formylglycine-generating enzyme required for sulfatase activity